MTKLEASEACREFAGTLNRVARHKERIVLSDKGRDVAVLVPMDDLALLERLEDFLDVQAAEAAEAEAAEKGETPINWAQARKALGL